MRLFVMFDLPTNTAEERKNATKFRKFLLNDGYYMMQYSIYVRVCNGWEAAKTHEARVQKALPPSGSVRILRITENQFQSMKIMCGKPIPDFDEKIEKNTVVSL